MTEEEKVAAAKERLRKAVRADKRADATKERTRVELRAAILELGELDIGPAEVAREMQHHLSEGHVSRMLLGKA